MKTNKTMTKCPEKVGHFCLSFGHFRLTDTNFAEIRSEFTVAYNNPHGHKTACARMWRPGFRAMVGHSGTIRVLTLTVRFDVVAASGANP